MVHKSQPLKKIAFFLTPLILASILVAALEATDVTHFFNEGNKPAATLTDSFKQHSPSQSSGTGTPSEEYKEAPKNNLETNRDSDKDTVEVVLTTYNTSDNDALSANGYVNKIIEAGGRCTLSATDSNEKTVSSTSTARRDASTTTCGNIRIPLSKLHAGTWKLVLSYESGDFVGSSRTVDARVE